MKSRKDTSGVYCIGIGGSFYVGSAVNISRRWNEHLSSLRNGRHKNNQMQRAWDENGPEISLDILVTCTPGDLLSFEQLFIDTLCPSLNISPVASSSLGLKRSDETKAKLRAAHLGRKLPWEQKEAIRKSLFGRPVSAETREKLAMQKGWKHSDGAKAKMRGRVVPEETRQKHRERMTGTALRQGKPCSDETRRKISEANTGRVLSEETRMRMREAAARRKANRS